MDKELISIIVPVYNVENYLSVCIRSILNQTYSNLEIILVNDHSTDGSGNVCYKYAKKDSRIKVLEHEINQGAGMSRNTGIDAANGRYLMFIDADDYVSANYVEELYKLLCRSKSDIAICLHRIVYDIKRISSVENNILFNYELMCSEEAIENVCYQRKIAPGPFAKLFKSELFNEIRFPNTGYEDLAIIYRILDRAKKIAYSPVEKYYYVQRKNNTTLGEFNEKKLDRIIVAEQMKFFIDSHYPNLRDAAVTRCFLANIQTLNVLPSQMLKTDCGLRIEKNIKLYRNSVMRNRKAKLITRFMALMSNLGIRNLKFLGSIYNMSQGVYKVKLK